MGGNSVSVIYSKQQMGGFTRQVLLPPLTRPDLMLFSLVCAIPGVVSEFLMPVVHPFGQAALMVEMLSCDYSSPIIGVNMLNLEF